MISALRAAGYPIKSAAVIKNLKGAEISGEYDDPTAEDGYTEEYFELAAPLPGREMCYLLLGLGGLESGGFDSGITLIKWEV